VWAAEGKKAVTLRAFYDELGEERNARLEAISSHKPRSEEAPVAGRRRDRPRRRTAPGGSSTLAGRCRRTRMP